MSPESSNIDVGLWDRLVCEEEPCTEDWLGKDVENGVGNNFLVNVEDASTISNTPDTKNLSVSARTAIMCLSLSYLHWVDSPDDQSEASDGSKEAADLTTLGSSSGAALDDELVDDYKVCNASDGVPSPLLWCVLTAKGSKETSEDHDKIGDDCNDDVSTADTGNQREIEKEKRCGNAPVNVSCPVHLSLDDVLDGQERLLLCVVNDGVVAQAVTGRHGEVGESGEEDDEGRDDVVQTLRLG